MIPKLCTSYTSNFINLWVIKKSNNLRTKKYGFVAVMKVEVNGLFSKGFQEHKSALAYWN
ncbi:MAG: hypothetical protein CM15mP48_1820 [Candidatus Poseidoniales archaeon]|nr:MAG: hypothetical protein CM15mP48_1820 [Candidatus Poseidoniales archaeon]